MDPIAEIIAAVKTDDLARVKACVPETAALAGTRNAQGDSAILLAAYYGRREILKYILARQPALDFIEAVAVGDVTRVATLAGPDRSRINTPAPDGWTPLHLAAFLGHRDLAAWLLDHGADLEAVSKNGTANTPLGAAAAGGQTVVALFLLDRGANPNAPAAGGHTPLHNAANNGNLELARALLQHGAKAGVRSADGKSPRDFAQARNHAAVVELLLQSGA